MSCSDAPNPAATLSFKSASPGSFSEEASSRRGWDRGIPSQAITSNPELMIATTVGLVHTGYTILQEVQRWLQDSWITPEQAKLVLCDPDREVSKAGIACLIAKHEELYRQEEGFVRVRSSQVFGTVDSFDYDLIKCSVNFELWKYQRKSNGLPEDYDPSRARNPVPGRFPVNADDNASVLTSVTTLL